MRELCGPLSTSNSERSPPLYQAGGDGWSARMVFRSLRARRQLVARLDQPSVQSSRRAICTNIETRQAFCGPAGSTRPGYAQQAYKHFLRYLERYSTTCRHLIRIFSSRKSNDIGRETSRRIASSMRRTSILTLHCVRLPCAIPSLPT